MNRLLMYIVVMAGVTYLIRCLPLIFFRKKIQNRYIQSFLYYVPYAVLGSMTFPAIFTSGGDLLPSCIGCVVALILAYQKRSLLVVALAASAAVCISTILIG
ncbi:AzlD domain-containing protein [Faecalicoccus pleomorphus]|uniref:AzlD domain-containing protein n=1 Tax=Faecalicoccus pleomorphus TaxID=1323 RepID=A0AAW6CWI0_9FIRM|nr:AzlD domain-containing protein [Faecalicoccus pleomorphus]MDB7980647.1 AzlD domain-containing protein [Faecalicoccus pleomorphus]MDB7982854.1 AzlD domain-containing protein [Faecalicoccus pleomorphus]